MTEIKLPLLIFGEEEALADIKKLAESAPMEATIFVNDEEAVNYWGVTEFGSAPGQRPWPSAKQKTQRGMGNRQGRIMSRQAPAGWVERNRDVIAGYLLDAVLKRMTGPTITEHEIREALLEAGWRAVGLLQAKVPKDTGRLRDSLSLKVGK